MFNNNSIQLSANVVNYEICDKNGDKYTSFRIQVKLGDQTWKVEKRYTEFKNLNSELKKIEPDIKVKFPGRNFLNIDNFSNSFLTKRMQTLNDFLNEAFTHQKIVRLPIIWDFLHIKPDQVKGRSLVVVQEIATQHREEKGRFENERRSSNDKTAENNVYLGTSNNPVARPSDFEFLKVIGKGSFGKVFQANHKLENTIYAIKVLSKEAILKRNEQKHIMAERNVLIRNLEHPFLVALHFSFQSNDKLYFVLDYVNGGELFFHLLRQRVFPESRVKFYAAEISHAIGYMHSKNIIYRDLKPENILIDSDGHIKLTDFGLCKEDIKANTTTSTFCGTPEYLAPEILQKKPYTRAVDWWCLGSVVYEMLYGLPPFYNRETSVMYNNILYNPLRLNPEINVSQLAKKIISELLRKEHHKRLGASEADFAEIRDHAFFADTNWQDVIEKRIPVPWVPTLESVNDTRHIDPEFTGEQVPASLGRSLVSSYVHTAANTEFSGFTYVPESTLR